MFWILTSAYNPFAGRVSVRAYAHPPYLVRVTWFRRLQEGVFANIVTSSYHEIGVVPLDPERPTARQAASGRYLLLTHEGLVVNELLI